MTRQTPLILALLVAGSLPAQGVEIPRPQGYVNDFAGVIAADEVGTMTRLIERVQAGSRGEIVIVTMRDLAGHDAADVALQIGREWGVGATAEIGDRARNAGVVVLLIPKETSSDGSGHIAIQVGQGAEGFITDGIAGDIRREATPLLAQRAYGAGLSLITARLAERYATEFGFQLDSGLVPRRRTAPQREIPPQVVFALIIALVIIVNIINRRRGYGRRGMILPIPFPMGRRNHWGGRGGGGWGGGGFGGGGFGGFGGGGGFSGGGSSGSF